MAVLEYVIKNTSEAELNIVIFLFSFLEYLLPIVPGDLALAFGIFMSVYGGYSTPLVFMTSIAGGTTGAVSAILIGRYVNKRYNSQKLIKLLKNVIANSDEKVTMAIELINKYGLLIIIMNRFIPVLRGPIVFAAGYSGVSLFKAISGSVLSAVLFNITIATVAFLAGKNFEKIKAFLSIYFKAFIILVIITFVVYKITAYYKRSRS
ncbi:MAG: VTT domain-containing protein [Deltaproteobacteria bacterium]|nr:VTT domain-containing protein [Deltaproteobacteria bacterium]